MLMLVLRLTDAECVLMPIHALYATLYASQAAQCYGYDR